MLLYNSHFISVIITVAELLVKAIKRFREQSFNMVMKMASRIFVSYSVKRQKEGNYQYLNFQKNYVGWYYSVCTYVRISVRTYICTHT